MVVSDRRPYHYRDFDFEQVPCHCTVGLGVPDADAMNIAVLPAVTVVELGFVVIDGAMLVAVTVSVAAVLVIDPATFMNTDDIDFRCSREARW